MKFTKKIIACLLVLSMMLSMAPMMAFADESTVASRAQEDSSTTSTEENALGATFTLKGATYFDDPPWDSNPTQTMIDHRDIKVPYNGWQLMRLDIAIPHQEGLEVKDIQPNIPSMYPEYSKVEKNDKNSIWTYSFFFEQNGTYDFTVNYVLNGNAQSENLSYVAEDLVSIKDIRMRRHLIDNYGKLTGFGDSPQLGWYVDKKILATPLIDPWGNISFDFGKDGDNGRTANYTRSLDGLQYTSNIHGMDLFECTHIDVENGETIEPITHTIYPNMKRLRVTEISANETDLPEEAYTPEMLARAIGNMPNLGELSLSGTGFKDFPVIGQLNGGLWYIASNFNEVESIEGIQKHKEISVLKVAKNQIQSVEPMRHATLDQLSFLDMGGNHIFDLSPMKDTLPKNIVGGQSFSARSQSIPYRKTIVSTLESDGYHIELPMPIDIDGTLTDTSEVTAHHKDGTSKIYPSSKKGGKTYIVVPKADVADDKKKPFEGITFQFAFNNNNGQDARTKGWFNGELAFKASPYADEYRVLYDFESGTRGMSLPSEVTDLLPVDGKVYSEGDTVKAIQPAQTTVSVADGVWTFKGYDADSKIASAENADEIRNVKFIGTWIFEKKPVMTDATVTFKVENGTWSDGSSDDKTVQVALTNGKGTLQKAQIPTGMKPAEGYEGGAWDVTPNTETNGITGNATYTYRFTKQSGSGSGGGVITTKYTLHYESNGGSAIEDERYIANKVVALDKVPSREDYQFTGWYADKDLTKKITEIKMTSDKTVYAGWKQRGDYIPGDLNSADHVAYVMGYVDGTVKPNADISRAETAAMLHRLLTDERRAEIDTTVNPFVDIKGNEWYAKPVYSMANGDYIAGYEDGTFGGNRSISRAEFVAMLVRFIGPEEAECTFNDVPKSHWAHDAIATATVAGWVEGYEDGSFGPDRNISRAEAMSIINRVLDRGVNADSTLLDFKKWPDNPKDAWYYYEIIEATNEHEYTGSRPSENWTSLNIG